MEARFDQISPDSRWQLVAAALAGGRIEMFDRTHKVWRQALPCPPADQRGEGDVMFGFFRGTAYRIAEMPADRLAVFKITITRIQAEMMFAMGSTQAPPDWWFYIPFDDLAGGETSNPSGAYATRDSALAPFDLPPRRVGDVVGDIKRGVEQQGYDLSTAEGRADFAFHVAHAFGAISDPAVKHFARDMLINWARQVIGDAFIGLPETL